MAAHYRSQGFIFKKTDFGEHDRIFAVYTKDFGRLDCLARAERKITSKLRGGLELFYLSEIEFIQGKTHKTLTDAVLINNFRELRKDLGKMIIVHKIAQTLDNLVRGQEPDKDIWDLLGDIFQKLNSEIKNGKPDIIYHYFLWNLLSILGYGPNLYNCAVCQKRLAPHGLFFSPVLGGILCPACAKNQEGIQKINTDIVKILRILFKKDRNIILRLKMEPEHQRLLENISGDYLSYIIEKE